MTTAVIVRSVVTKLDGEVATIFYGPFLPHVGSVTTSFIARLESELRPADSGPDRPD